MTDENLAFLPDNLVMQKIALVESLSVINYEPKNRGRIAEKIVKFDLQLNTKRGLVHTLGQKKINFLSEKFIMAGEVIIGRKIAPFSLLRALK